MKINQLYPYTVAEFPRDKDFSALLAALEHLGYDQECRNLRKGDAMRLSMEESRRIVFFDDDLFNLTAPNVFENRFPASSFIEPMDMINMLLGTYAGDQSEREKMFLRSHKISLLPYMAVKTASKEEFDAHVERILYNGHMYRAEYNPEYPYVGLNPQYFFCGQSFTFCPLTEKRFFELLEGKDMPTGYERMLSEKSQKHVEDRKKERGNPFEGLAAILRGH